MRGRFLLVLLISCAIGSLFSLGVDFSATPRHGDVALTVDFTSSITNYDDIISYTWDFGDGSGSDEADPQHIYQFAGIYTVSLTVEATDDGINVQDTETKDDYITVDGAIDFIGNPLAGGVPLLVTFQCDTADFDSVLTYEWDFGDNEDSDEENPQHTYVHAGLYDVTLTITVVMEGEEEEIELEKEEYIAVYGIDAALVVDCSSSMVGNKLGAAQNACAQFLDLLNDGDEIGAVGFSQHVEYFAPIVMAPDIASVSSTIGNMNATVYTSIGTGVLSGWNDILNLSVDSDWPKAMIILSDGRDNAVPLYSQITWPTQINATRLRIYPIGYGSDVATAYLQGMVNGHAGFYTAASTGGISQALQNIYVVHAGADRSLFDEGQLPVGNTITRDINIDGSYRTAVFNLNWNDATADLDMSVISPSGVVYTQPIGMSTHAMPTQHLIDIDNPEPGVWQMVVSNASTVLADPEQYFCNVYGFTEMRMDYAFDNEEYTLSDPVTVRLSLKNYDKLVVGATATMTVSTPDEKTYTIPCVWDASENSYIGKFDKAEVEGNYHFTFAMTGNHPEFGRYDRSIIVEHYLGEPAVEERLEAGEDSAPQAQNIGLAFSPNPFNPSTAISFSLAQPGATELHIYNLRGERVRTLINETLSAGEHQVQWNGTDDNGRPVASGVYLFALRSGHLTSTGKAILLK
jgi:PKD repeat protein